MAKGEYVVVGSKLPIGLILQHPADPTEKVTVEGLNSAPRGTNGQPIVIPYRTTLVPRTFWNAWHMAHAGKNGKPFPALTSGAIFVADDLDSAKSIYRENEKRLTGLEPAGQKSLGVKPADKD